MNRLKKYREEAGLTQKQLADCSGLSIDAIQKYEYKEEALLRARISNVLKISDCLKTEPEQLLDYDALRQVINSRKEAFIKGRPEEPDFYKLYRKYYMSIKKWEKREVVGFKTAELLINSSEQLYDDYKKLAVDKKLPAEAQKKYIEEMQTLLFPHAPFGVNYSLDTKIGKYRRMRYIKNVPLKELSYCIEKSESVLRNYENLPEKMETIPFETATEIAIVLECGIRDIFAV